MGDRRVSVYSIQRDESGQTLVIALVLLALATLLVTGLLYYASTSQQSTKAARRQITDLYSADAGVEHALWRIDNEPAFRQTVMLNGTQSYTQSINGNTVVISVTQSITSPAGGGGPGGGSLAVYGVWVEPDQAGFVLPSGSSHTYSLAVINAGRVNDSFETEMNLHFDTRSGNVRWSIQVRDGSGTLVYSLINYRPPQGLHTISTGVFDTTPSLDPGESEVYQVTVTKGTQGGRGDILEIEFIACSVGAAGESPPQTVCDASWLGTSVESQNTPAIGMSKSAWPLVVGPGDRIDYTVTCLNAGDGTADTVEVVDTLPDEAEAGFVVGSVSVGGGSISYSNDGGTTWTYTPTPDADGLDRAVDAIRWVLTNVAAGTSYDLSLAVQVNDPFTSTATLIRNAAQAIWWDGGTQYGPTSTTFNNPIVLPPIYQIYAASAETTILAYAEFDDGTLRILSWEFLP
jgi:uncharacterized repeat protein (TIGR01451 family)